MPSDEHFMPTATFADYLTRYQVSHDQWDLCGVHHWIHYEWAKRCLADWPIRTVLDLGCGAGYGAHSIAVAYPDMTVVGVDYDSNAIDKTNQFAASNLSFRLGDPTRWSETIASTFDCILCFEVIEHVSHREIMLENTVNHLAEGGRLLLTTPCGHDINQLTPPWEHHHLEYSSRSLFDFLSRYFRTIIRPELAEFPHRDIFDGVDYLLKMNPVICADPIVIPNPYPFISSV